jgi:hypothetical protein
MQPLPEPPTDLALPAPPPPVPETPPETGQLDSFFTTAFWIGWVGVAAGMAAVWYSSRILGFATWWLGPESQPRFIVVSLLPFVAPLALAVMALLHRPWLPFLGILGAAITALVAVGDVGGPAGYWVAELVLAGGGLAVSLAAFAGMYRAGAAAEAG